GARQHAACVGDEARIPGARARLEVDALLRVEFGGREQEGFVVAARHLGGIHTQRKTTSSVGAALGLAAFAHVLCLPLDPRVRAAPGSERSAARDRTLILSRDAGRRCASAAKFPSLTELRGRAGLPTQIDEPVSLFIAEDEPSSLALAGLG